MLKGIYREVIKDFGTRTFNDIQSRANEIKAVEKFSVLTEDIENYIDDVSAEKVVLITETTKRDIKKIVQNAVQEGQSIPQMKKAIDGLYLDNIIPNRSRTIARTEVVSASNYGSYAGAKQTPSRLKKIWIPTFDDSTRESHLAMANHPAIGLDENFNVNGSYGQYPGDFSLPASEVINCRCAIGYEYVALPTEIQRTVEAEQPIVTNPLYPDEIAGVKRGKEMTRDEANHGKPNPNYQLGGGYTINCQSCVVTYEARLRGYNVSTLPNKAGSKLEELSRNTSRAWIDPVTGSHPSYIFDNNTTTPKKYFEYLTKVVEKGARYTVEFAWKGSKRSGHIISLDRDENNGIRLYDPQTGKTYTGRDVLKYLGRLKYQVTSYGKKYPLVPKILRIDDKQFNPDYSDNIMERVIE